MSGNKDDESSYEEDFVYEKIRPAVKSFRPVSAKNEFSRQKSSSKTRQLPINIKKSKTKKTVDYSILSKLRPRRVTIDKERLYEDNMALKYKNNNLMEELIRLRTRMSQIEKELNRKDEQSDNSVFSKPVHMVNSLKMTVKDLKTEIFNKNEEIAKLKKHIKSTKINEIELEVQAYIDECTRLRHHLEEVMRQRDSPQATQNIPDDKSMQTAVIINGLKKENEELNSALNQSVSEINKMKEKLQELEKVKKKTKKSENTGLKTENLKLKHQLEALSKEFGEKENGLKEEMAKMKKKLSESVAKVQGYETRIKELVSENEEMSKKLRSQDKDAPKKEENKKKPEESSRKLDNEPKKQEDQSKKFEETKKKDEEKAKIEEIKRKDEEKAKIEEKKSKPEEKKPKIQEEIPKFNEKKSKAEEEIPKHEEKKFKAEEITKKDLSHKSIPGKVKIDYKKNGDYIKEIPESPSNPSTSSKLPSQVEAIFSHFSFRMQINRIPKTKLFSTLFGTLSQDKQLSKTELSSLLKKPPFNFAPTDIDQINTFLLDSPKSTTKSIEDKIYKFTEDWEVFTPADEEGFDEKIGEIIQEHKEKLLEESKKCDKKNLGVISVGEFKSALDKCKAMIPQRVFRYMMLLFYSHNMKLDEVPYFHFIKAYGESGEGEVSDEEKAKIVRHYLSLMAEVLISNKKGVFDVFECDDNGLLTPDDFYAGLGRMGLGDVEEDHIMLMIEALQLEESSEVCINIEELEEILKHYGVNNPEDPDQKHIKKVSMLDSDNLELSEESPQKVVKKSFKNLSQSSPFKKNKSLDLDSGSSSDYNDDFQ